MNNETKDQRQPDPQNDPQKGFDKDQPGHSPGQRQPDPSQADDRGRRAPSSDNQHAIPELDEPDVEGVGNEGRQGTTPTTPSGDRR